MFVRKIFSSSKHRPVREVPSEGDSSTPPASRRTERSKSEGSNVASEVTKGDLTPPSLAHRSSSTASTLAPSSVPVHQHRLTSSVSALASLSRTETVNLDRNSDPLGLSLIYTPAHPPSADIIFVHGLGGSSRLSWCSSRGLDTFWPQLWLPEDRDTSRARIFTFGYNANFRSSTQSSALGISDFSKHLLYDMLFATDSQGAPLRFGQVPIIFVAHSMGGLVVKKAYLDAQLDNQHAAAMRSIKAIIFLSTPHRGSDLAPFLQKLLYVSLGPTSKQYVGELDGFSSLIRTINEQFRHVANGLQIFSFYETLQTSIRLGSALILNAESAKLGYPGEVSRYLDANHHNVCKFENREDSNYRAVMGALKSLVSSYHSPGDSESSAQDVERLRDLLSVAKSVDRDFDLHCSRRAEGTCRWVLEQDQVGTWLSFPSCPEILMLHGRPGRGKSVIASFLAQHLREQGAAVQYFFVNAGDETRRSMAALIRTLAFQIAQRLPSFRKALIEMADGGYKLRDSEWRSTWNKLFVNLLFEMEFSPPLFWVIDGVDEASSPHHLFELLSDLQYSKIPIRVLVTNRWSQSLMSAFERTGSRVSSSTLSLDNDITDMRLFVEDELKYNIWDEEITRKVVREVLDRSNNNFLWVRLILDELKDCNTEEDIWDRLRELPPGMDGMYRRMEESICRIRRPSDKNLARQLLTWAIHTRRTLAGEELADVLEPEFGRLLDLSHTANRLCGHFIAVDGDNRIGLIHHTAREYLTTTATSLPFSLDSTVAHAQLFTQSIACFLDKGLRSKLQRSSPSLLEYRASSWPYHLSATELHQGGRDQLDLLTRFFSQQSVLVWIHVLASLGRLRVLVEASRSLYTFVVRKRRADAANDPASRRYDELEVLEGWSRDLLKLLGKFGSCLTERPDAIYTSVAPFCPTASSVFKAFGVQKTGSLVIRGLPENWDDCLARVSVGANSMARLICCSGRYIAVGSTAKAVVVWDCTTFHQVNELDHGEAISAICFSSRGDRLAAYGLRQTKIWNPQTGKLLLSIPNPTGMRALCLQFVDNDNTIVAGTDYRRVMRCPTPASLDTVGSSESSGSSSSWSDIDSQLLNDSEPLDGSYFLNSPLALALSPDGSKIAAAYRGFPLSIWSVSPAAPLRLLIRPPMPGRAGKPLPFVSSISWHPGGDEILGILLDGCSFRLNIVDGSYHEQSPAPRQMPSRILCSPDGQVYAICGVNGTIRLFDYQSSTLIYQLSSQDPLTSLCFSQDGRKLYDIRGSHCTIWEPNALMRLTAADDDPASSHTADDSARQSRVASETFVDGSVSILFMSPSPRGHVVCFGDENGRVELFDYETSERVEVGRTATCMSIEHLAWSEDDSHICYGELASELTVVQLERTDDGSRTAREVEVFDPKLNPGGGIKQVLFLQGSTSLLVSSTSSIQRWSLGPARLEATHNYEPPSPLSSSSRSSPPKWIPHPRSPEHLLAIAPDRVSMHRSTDLEEVSSLRWHSSTDAATTTSQSNRASSSAAVDAEPGAEIEEEVESVDPTFVEDYVLIRVSRRTRSRKLQSRFLILDAGQLVAKRDTAAIAPIDVPARVSDMVEMPLGVLPNGRLVFLDRSFWVCSWQTRPMTTPGAAAAATAAVTMRGEDDVERHFFIPRDWLPLQSLGLLRITSAGAILCPRKGSVSVIQSSIGAKF